MTQVPAPDVSEINNNMMHNLIKKLLTCYLLTSIGTPYSYSILTLMVSVYLL